MVGRTAAADGAAYVTHVLSSVIGGVDQPNGAYEVGRYGGTKVRELLMGREATPSGVI